MNRAMISARSLKMASLLFTESSINKIISRNVSSTPAMLAGWARDFKPGPYPRTEEERIKAAKKYNMRPEDYRPFPDDGMGWGDYPMLKEESPDMKSDWENYDDPYAKRHFGDPYIITAELLTTDKISLKDLWTTPSKIFLCFLASSGLWFGLHYLTHDLKLTVPVMKRIKCEDVQNMIQNYVKQRNLCNNNYLAKFSSQKINIELSSETAQAAAATTITSLNSAHAVDLNLMALNDLALIESSINDYYSYSFDALSEAEYTKQFENLISLILKNSAETNSKEFERFVYPFLVYICIDLILAGISIERFINKFLTDEKKSRFIQLTEQKSMCELLLAFNESRDLNKYPILNEWIENKYRIDSSVSSWKTFLKILTKSKAYLFVRIINLNFQINLAKNAHKSSSSMEYDQNEQNEREEQTISDAAPQVNLIKSEAATATATTSLWRQLNQEMSENSLKMTNIKLECLDQADESIATGSCSSSPRVDLQSLAECISRIGQTQPSRINAACSFFLDDVQDSITSSSISPSGERLAFTSENSSVYLYQLYDDHSEVNSRAATRRAASHCQQELIGGHSGVVFKSKFTHDSKYLISCGDDGQACLWNVNSESAAQQQQQNERQTLHDMETSSSEQDLFEIKIRASTSGHERSTKLLPTCFYSAHLYPVWDVEPFSRLNLFATGSRDSTARLWSFDRVYPLRNYCGHHSDVNCVRFHPNGSYLATGSSDKTVRLWSVQSGEFMRLFTGHKSRVFTVAFSPDGNYLASSGEDKRIKLWDIRSGGLCKELKGHTDIVYALEFDNNSDILCSGGLDKTVKFWNLHSKNITIEPDFVAKSSFKSNKTGSNVNSPFGVSNELMRSVNVNFNVYSISTDVQNVFYFSGARKPATQPFRSASKASDSGLEKSNALKSEPLNTSQSGFGTSLSVNTPTMPSTSGSSFTAKTKAKSTIESSAISLPTSRTTQSVLASNTAALSSAKPVINTRRRAAAASANSQQQQQAPPPNSTNFLLDNDDLYEV